MKLLKSFFDNYMNNCKKEKLKPKFMKKKLSESRYFSKLKHKYNYNTEMQDKKINLDEILTILKIMKYNSE